LTLGSVAAVDGVLVGLALEAEAAALTAVAPLEATSLPPPQDASPKVATNMKAVMYVRMIYPYLLVS